jgi:hypothetical protein
LASLFIEKGHVQYGVDKEDSPLVWVFWTLGFYLSMTKYFSEAERTKYFPPFSWTPAAPHFDSSKWLVGVKKKGTCPCSGGPVLVTHCPWPPAAFNLVTSLAAVPSFCMRIKLRNQDLAWA